MNVPFCLWLHRRARGGDRVELMVHEPYLEFGAGPPYHALTAVTHRLMTMVLLNASSHVWIAIPAWERYLKPYLFGRRVPLTWLPIPTGVKPPQIAEIAAIRVKYAREGGLVGHFGTFNPAISRLLRERLPSVLNGLPAPSLLLTGRGSEVFRQQLLGAHPELTDRVHAVGFVSPSRLGAHLAACDLCVQPYPDGISSRRTTAMACLSLGIPIVTTHGHLTEQLWRESGAVSLADVADTVTFVRQVLGLLGDQQARLRLGERARAFYELHFSAARVVGVLRDGPSRTYPAASAAIA
jgi:glycosyltransferase involved in cell wall biosynthesis